MRLVLHRAYFGSATNLLVHCYQYLLPHRAQLAAFVEVDPWKRPHEAWVVRNRTRYCEHCSAGVAAAACRHLRRTNPYLHPAVAAYLVAWLAVAGEVTLAAVDTVVVVTFAFVAAAVETFAFAAVVETFAFAKVAVAAGFDFVVVAAVALAVLASLAAVEAFFAAGVALEVVNIAAPAAALEQWSKTAL